MLLTLMIGVSVVNTQLKLKTKKVSSNIVKKRASKQGKNEATSVGVPPKKKQRKLVIPKLNG